MKRSVFLLLLLGLLLLALPLCAHSEEGDSANMLGVGQSRTYQDWHRLNYILSTESLTPGIVSVDYDTVTGVSPGTGVIRCSWSRYDMITPITEDFQIRVFPAPAGVSFSETSIKLGLDEPWRFAAILTEGSFGSVYFSCNTQTMSLSQDGMYVNLRPHALGVFQVNVTTYNGKTAACQVEVVPGPTGISLSPTTLTLFSGQTHALQAEALGGYTKTGVKFWSANSDICTVSKDGKVTAIAPGSTYVKAELYAYYAQYCQITVCDEPDAILLDGIQTRVSVGDTMAFTPRDSKGNSLLLALSFSNSSVLTRESGNTLRALKPGVCTVTASSSTKSASMEITVLPAPAGITLSPSEITLKELETVSLAAILPEGTVSAIDYDSTDDAVATVTDGGTVTARRPGSAIISARTYNNKYAYCHVTVAVSELTYTLTPENGQVGIGKTLQLHLKDRNGNVIPATYRSEVEGIATVNGTGLVTGVRRGLVKITATVQDGRKYEVIVEVIAIPESITVSPTSMTLRVGETGYYYLDSDVGPYFDFTSSSSNQNVVRITPASDASFNAVGVGTATVTVTSLNGKKATIAVTVLPRENTLTPTWGDGMDLGVGETKNMNVRDINGNPVSCTYVSSNTKVARVDSRGNITGIGSYPSSYARVTAKAKDGRTAQVEVGTYPAPGYLKLNVDSLRMPVGDTFQLEARTQPESRAFSTVYSSSNKNVATVSKAGLVTAKGAGTCTITAKVYNGKYDKVDVTVGTAPASVSLSPAKLTLGLNESRKLKVSLSPGAISEHFYLCSDPTIVSVYDDVVKGLKLGSATLTVKTNNGKTADCLVTVVNAPGSITLTSPAKAIGVKQTVQLKATLPDGTAGAIKYTSGNTKVATVDASGKVTGIKTGSVTITATTYNGKKATVTLQVKKAPSSIKLNIKSAKLGVGDTVKLTATLKSGSAGTYTYKSSNAKVATVDKNGLVTATGAGKATITATTHNGKKATCTVTVYKQPGSVTVKSAFTLKKGRTYTLKVTFPKNTYSRVTFSSSNEKVAAVDSAGKVRGVGRGTATITVTCSNGKTAKCVVTVK